MRKTILAIAQNIGKLAGVLLSVCPRRIKKWATHAAQVLVTTTTGKRSSGAYLIGYEIIKRMYHNEKRPVMLTKIFDAGFKMGLDVRKKTQRILYLQKVYEPYVLYYILNNLHKGDTFVDIGANVGVYTLLAAKIVGNSGTVFSFEPEKNNYETLVSNIALNNFKNVTTKQCAVGAQNGTMTLNINPLNEGGASLMNLKQYHDDEEVWSKEDIKKKFPDVVLEQKTEVVTLDSYLKNRVPTMIKIDVEGAELDVLEGAKKVLGKSDAPDIICEVGRDGEKIFDFLMSCGYSLYILDKNGFPIPCQKDTETKVKALLASKHSL